MALLINKDQTTETHIAFDGAEPNQIIAKPGEALTTIDGNIKILVTDHITADKNGNFYIRKDLILEDIDNDTLIDNMAVYMVNKENINEINEIINKYLGK